MKDWMRVARLLVVVGLATAAVGTSQGGLAAVRNKAGLARFDGSDLELPLAMGLRGIIFDVSSGAAFYGCPHPAHVPSKC
jgi:hypothetical protein